MAAIRIFHPAEALNEKLKAAEFENGQIIKEDEVLAAVGIILAATELNVMIERQIFTGTHNQSSTSTVIWVDTGRFRQK